MAPTRALKLHGGVPKEKLAEENLPAVRKGFANLLRHLGIIRRFGLPVVVAINRFVGNHVEEINGMVKGCDDIGVPSAISDVFTNGGEGGLDLARKVIDTIECTKCSFSPLPS